MSDSPALLTIDGDVAHLRLTRPAVRNALRPSDVDHLHSLLDQVGEARALVVSGEGPAFCAGRDLSDAEPLTEDAGSILRDIYNPLLRRVRHLRFPTFAAVHGPCLGVGLGLALACDVVVVAEDAKLGSPFARIGAVLDSGGHHHLVRRLGEHRALELSYTGRLLSGAEAAAWGLVNRAVPAADLLDGVLAEAARVAAGPTQAFRLSKALVLRVADEAMSLDDVLDAEADAQAHASRTPDYAEGITAFQEKRQPMFTGAESTSTNAADGGDQVGDAICPRCAGTGRTDDGTCGECGGTGVREELVGDA